MLMRRFRWSKAVVAMSVTAGMLASLSAPVLAVDGADLAESASDVLPTIEVTVVDARALESAEGRASTVVPHDLAPVEGAIVTAPSIGFESVTDANGRLDIHDFPVETVDDVDYILTRIVVTAPGFGVRTLDDVPIPTSGDTLRLWVDLGQSAVTTLHGLPGPRARADASNSASVLDPSLSALELATGSAGGIVVNSHSGACTGWTSNLSEPETIRVRRVSTGQVQTYDFDFYVKHVLASEWISSWPMQSLKSGAIAVKNYGWYFAMHLKQGYPSGSNCYDVRDDTADQVFNPNVSFASTDRAINETMDWTVRKNGVIFPAFYSAGFGLGCGQLNSGGTTMRQWGTRACALAGWNWQKIVNAYYNNPSVTYYPQYAGHGNHPTSSGAYWRVRADGSVAASGGAGFYGGANYIGPDVVDLNGTTSGGGYWLAASDGGVFSYGNAGFFGSAGGLNLAQPVVGMSSTSNNGGYWLVAADGGIFSYGNAGFFGSLGGVALNAPISDIARTANNAGYWLLGEDGGVFAFGNAGFFGSAAGSISTRAVSIERSVTGNGYRIVMEDGQKLTFGS